MNEQEDFLSDVDDVLQFILLTGVALAVCYVLVSLIDAVGNFVDTTVAPAVMSIGRAAVTGIGGALR